jgi:hypothetical protein
MLGDDLPGVEQMRRYLLKYSQFTPSFNGGFEMKTKKFKTHPASVPATPQTADLTAHPAAAGSRAKVEPAVDPQPDTQSPDSLSDLME